MIRRGRLVLFLVGMVGLAVGSGWLIYQKFFQWDFVSPIGLRVLTASVEAGIGGPVIGCRAGEGKFVSPLSDCPEIGGMGEQFGVRRKRKTDYQVMGFLPYWLIKHEEGIRYPLLTQLAYFGLEFDADGQPKTRMEDGTAEMGHYRLGGETISSVIRKSRESGVEPVLVIRAMDNQLIESLLATRNSRGGLVKEIVEQKERKHFSGVNIDFEYVGTPKAVTRANFTDFVKELRLRMASDRRGGGSLSVDVYADAVRKVRLWNVPVVAGYVDYLVIMAYDFHRASSVVAGPVAPLRGGCDGWGEAGGCRWNYDVTSAVADFVGEVSREKLILGVPYYGYEWQTTGEAVTSPVVPQTGALATYKRVKGKMEELGAVINGEGKAVEWKLNFDSQAMSPTLVYKENGASYQRVWFEDEMSLRLKYQLVKEAGLAGVAIWALGYDAGYEELWKLLEEEFSR